MLIQRQNKKRLSLRFKKILSDAAASAVLATCVFGFMAMSLKACDAEYENQIKATKAHLEATPSLPTEVLPVLMSPIPSSPSSFS